MSKKKKSGRNFLDDELTKTQVLNLNDFENVTKYEKSVSKQPCVFFSVLGVICIALGVAYTPFVNYVVKKVAPPPTVISRRIIDMKKEADYERVTYRLNKLGNKNGTDEVIDFNLVFDEDKLVKYSKNLIYTSAIGKEEDSKEEIAKRLAEFKACEELDILGYKVKTNTIDNGIQTIVSINLKNLDINLLTDECKKNTITNVEFALNDSKEVVINKLKERGYVEN